MSKHHLADRAAYRRYQKLRLVILASQPACAICGKPGADSIDHIVPLSKGGRIDDLANMRPAHQFPCNHQRGVEPVSMPRSREW